MRDEAPQNTVFGKLSESCFCGVLQIGRNASARDGQDCTLQEHPALGHLQESESVPETEGFFSGKRRIICRERELIEGYRSPRGLIQRVEQSFNAT